MSEERGFEINDRRRVRADAEGAEETAHAGAAENSAEPAEHVHGPGCAHHHDDELVTEADFDDQPLMNPLAQLGVSEVVRMTVSLLNEKAWINLGLLPNPMTGQVEQNLPEARRGIDVIADLVKHLEADASPQEKRELQVLVNNLRLNFVRQSSQSS